MCVFVARQICITFAHALKYAIEHTYAAVPKVFQLFIEHQPIRQTGLILYIVKSLSLYLSDKKNEWSYIIRLSLAFLSPFLYIHFFSCLVDLMVGTFFFVVFCFIELHNKKRKYSIAHIQHFECERAIVSMFFFFFTVCS